MDSDPGMQRAASGVGPRKPRHWEAVRPAPEQGGNEGGMQRSGSSAAMGSGGAGRTGGGAPARPASFAARKHDPDLFPAQAQSEASKPAPYKAPSLVAGAPGDAAVASGENRDGSGSRGRGTSPHQPAVPCVAHGVYTYHRDCGCLQSPKRIRRRQSPTHGDDKRDGSPDPGMPPPKTPTPIPTPRPPPFSPPQRIAVLSGLSNVRQAAGSGPFDECVLATDRTGQLALCRAIAGESAATVVEKGPICSALSSFHNNIWAGFVDGSIRVYTDQGVKLAEASRHAGAVTALAESNTFVFSASMDWKILRWALTGTPSGEFRLYAFPYGGHSLGVRTLTSAKIGGTLNMLFSGSDDCEIRAWAVGANTAEDTTASEDRPLSRKMSGVGAEASFSLIGHTKPVVALLFHRDVLWSGGEDCEIRLWNVRTRTTTNIFTQHKTPIVAIRKVGEQNIWTMSRSGQTVVFHAETQTPIYFASFGEGIKGKNPSQLIGIKPVMGHVVWITDPAGTTTSWYCPTPVSIADFDHTLRSGSFENHELLTQQLLDLEAKEHALFSDLNNRFDERQTVLGDFVDESCKAAALRIEQLIKQANSGVLIDEGTLRLKDEELADLKQKLEAALRELDEMRQAWSASGEAAERYNSLLETHKANEEKLKKQIADLQKKLKEAETKKSAQKALEDEVSALQEKLLALTKSLEEKDSTLARMRKALDDAKTKLKEAANATTQTELETLREELKKAKAREIGMQTEIEELKGELRGAHLREEELMHGLKQLEDSKSGHLKSQSEETKKLLAQLQVAQEEVERLKALLNHHYNETRDRDLVERRRQQEHDEYITRLMEDHQRALEELRAKLTDLMNENRTLASRGDDNALLREVNNLRAEVSRLKHELTVNRHHLTRLASQDLQNRKRNLKSPERVEVSPAPPPRRSDVVHDPSDPHHRATCPWCSGATLAGVGGTMGIHSSAYKDFVNRAASKDRRSASSPTKPEVINPLQENGVPSVKRSVSKNREVSPNQRPKIVSPITKSIQPNREIASESPVRSVPPLPVASPKSTNGPATTPSVATPEASQKAPSLKDQIAAQEQRAALVAEILALHSEMVDGRAGSPAGKK